MYSCCIEFVSQFLDYILFSWTTSSWCQCYPSQMRLPKTHVYRKSWFTGMTLIICIHLFLCSLLDSQFFPQPHSVPCLSSFSTTTCLSGLKVLFLIFCQYILFQVYQVCCDLEGYCICLWTQAMARSSFPELSRGSLLRWKCFGALHLEVAMYQMQGSDSRFCGK